MGRGYVRLPEIRRAAAPIPGADAFGDAVSDGGGAGGEDHAVGGDGGAMHAWWWTRRG